MDRQRCKPQNLIMAEAVPYGQRWTYHDKWDIEVMLSEEFFISERDRLRTGDDMRIIKQEGEEIHSFVDVLVVSTKPLAFHTLAGPVDVKSKKPKQANKNAKKAEPSQLVV